jgi:uncharacterized protein with WD repeat
MEAVNVIKVAAVHGKVLDILVVGKTTDVIYTQDIGEDFVSLLQSKQHIIITTQNCIWLLNANKNFEVANLIKEPFIRYSLISPNQEYLAYITRGSYAKECGIVIFSIKTMTPIKKFSSDCDKEYNEIVRWSKDSNFFAILERKTEISLYSVEKATSINFPCKNVILSYTISSKYIIVLSKSSHELIVAIYSVQDPSTPKHESSIKNAEEGQCIWDDIEKNLFIISDTIEDKTGKSYYGKQALHIFSLGSKITQLTCDSITDQIHSIQWVPKTDRFIAIHGIQPALITLHDITGKQIAALGKKYRNTIKFCPFGQFMFIGGFGSLAGELDFFNYQEPPLLIGSCEAHGSVQWDWHSGGRHILVAETYPRRMVDNQLKIIKYNGQLIATKKYDHLYGVMIINNEKNECRPMTPIDTTKPKPVKERKIFAPKAQDEDLRGAMQKFLDMETKKPEPKKESQFPPGFSPIKHTPNPDSKPKKEKKAKKDKKANKKKEKKKGE